MHSSTDPRFPTDLLSALPAMGEHRNKLMVRYYAEVETQPSKESTANQLCSGVALIAAKRRPRSHNDKLTSAGGEP